MTVSTRSPRTQLSGAVNGSPVRVKASAGWLGVTDAAQPIPGTQAGDMRMPLNTIEPSKRIFLSVEEVAQLFGLSKKTVYRLLDRGLLRSSNAVRHKMILKASVDEFVAKTVNNG